jgi:hypothetical protein
MSALSHTDKIVGVASLVLLVSLFLTWFSYNAGIVVLTASGLSAHGYLYIPLLISIAIVVLMALSATGLWSLPGNASVNRDQLLLTATTISFVLVLIGFLSKPGGSGVGWNFGAFLGLAAAVVALVPLARPVIQARRGRSS